MGNPCVYNWDDGVKNGFQVPYNQIQRNDFHVGEYNKTTPAETIVCKKCVADTFMVGCAYLFVAIKCLNCGWEYPLQNE